MMKTVGEFRLNVSDGYPVWISIQRSYEEEIRFPHDELRDLEYVVISAIKQAQENLGAGGKEV